jgi:hypothetical protein
MSAIALESRRARAKTVLRIVGDIIEPTSGDGDSQRQDRAARTAPRLR